MQSHTFASPTNQRSSQSLQKSVSASTQNKIQNIFSCPSKKIKTPDTQTNPTKTVERSIENGFQARTKERQLPTMHTAQCLVSCALDATQVIEIFRCFISFTTNTRH